jgi:alginate O-acetyltransferase complex protein AlgI
MGGLPLISAETLYYLRSYAVTFLAAAAGATPLPAMLAQRLFRPGKLLHAAEPVFLVVLLLIATAYLVDGSFNPFLYFRF